MLSAMDNRKKIEVAWQVLKDDLMPNMIGWTYGVILFNDYAYWIVYPQQDTTALAITSPSATGRTAMGMGLRVAWQWVKTHAKEARFILLSDGMPTDMSKQEILDTAKVNNIPIDTVGIGQGNDYDPIFLQSLSSITGGIFSEASSVKLLSETILKLSPSQRPLLGEVKK